MIRIKLGTTTERKEVITDVNSTILSVLKENQISISGSVMTLNGAPVDTAALEKTFAEMGVADESTAMLIAVRKADSAN